MDKKLGTVEFGVDFSELEEGDSNLLEIWVSKGFLEVPRLALDISRVSFSRNFDVKCICLGLRNACVAGVIDIKKIGLDSGKNTEGLGTNSSSISDQLFRLEKMGVFNIGSEEYWDLIEGLSSKAGHHIISLEDLYTLFRWSELFDEYREFFRRSKKVLEEIVVQIASSTDKKILFEFFGNFSFHESSEEQKNTSKQEACANRSRQLKESGNDSKRLSVFALTQNSKTDTLTISCKKQDQQNAGKKLEKYGLEILSLRTVYYKVAV